MVHLPLQVASFLEVVPAWLPVVTVSLGVCLLLFGMGEQYIGAHIGHWKAYTERTGALLAGSLTGSIAGATYLTIRQAELTLLFIFFTFISGQLIQGAVAARIIQKIIDFFKPSDGGEGSDQSLLARGYAFAKAKIKDRLIIVAVTSVLSTYMTLSILSVFVLGSGEPLEAIERFWTGVLLLTIAGIAFDFRYFSHRLSWPAALGLVVATSGAFLYSPVGFSNVTTALAPYLDNPLPDWMRLPLRAFGFFAGVVFWALFYIKEG
ncbi:hypothetical protein [Haloarcula quadrata]|nr:hypothetical protein [Haloarcula quadrata]